MNMPAQFTTGRQGRGALVLKTPQPHPSTAPWLSVPAVKVHAPWECRLGRSSASGSVWDRCHLRSKLFFSLSPMEPYVAVFWAFISVNISFWTNCRMISLSFKPLIATQHYGSQRVGTFSFQRKFNTRLILMISAPLSKQKQLSSSRALVNRSCLLMCEIIKTRAFLVLGCCFKRLG